MAPNPGMPTPKPSFMYILSNSGRGVKLVLGSRIERTGFFITNEVPLTWQFAMQMSDFLPVEHFIDEEV